jgi:hypothetical protein
MRTYEPYTSIISKHLKRTKESEEYTYDETHRLTPKFVVTMCEELLKTIHERGGTSVTIDDVIRADGCAAGHCDYHDKAALYMHELEIGRWRHPDA